MGLSTIVIRPFNWAFRSPAKRAASPHTSDRGVEQLLKKPGLEIAALDNVLDRVHRSPRLALAILIFNPFTNTKQDAVRKVREQMKYPSALYEPSPLILPLAGMLNLPPFFRLLAEQPAPVVHEAHQLWNLGVNSSIGSGRGWDKSSSGPITFMSALERHLEAVSKGYGKIFEATVPVTPRAKQMIVGYNIKLAETGGKITDHYYYFISGCQVDSLTFDYQFRPERSLA
jgi:hypothetical protein